MSSQELEAPFHERLAARVREAREATGRSQTEVAGALGISRASLSQYETGQRGISVEMLQRIARLYGRSFGELIP